MTGFGTALTSIINRRVNFSEVVITSHFDIGKYFHQLFS